MSRATAVRTQTVWKIPNNHVASGCADTSCDDFRYSDRGDEGCPHRLRFHDRTKALDALDAWIRLKAERDPLSVSLAPSIGPRFCDFDWQRDHGGPATWEWRVHEYAVTRDETRVLVEGTLDVRTMGTRTMRTYADVDGETIAAGWITRKVVVEDWAPWQGQNTVFGDQGKRIENGWDIEPESEIIEWGDGPEELDDELDLAYQEAAGSFGVPVERVLALLPGGATLDGEEVDVEVIESERGGGA